jgi:peptide/nickel transport system ATP-binding protein
VVAEIAGEIAVMYSGRVVEHATTSRIFSEPQHPYTWGLLKSIPRLDSPAGEELVPISGRPPSLIHRPSGCHFHPRCPYVRDSHKRVDPRLEPVPGETNHEVACLLPAGVRMRIWRGLAEGRQPIELRPLAAEADGRPVAALAGEPEPALSEPEPGTEVEPAGVRQPPTSDPSRGVGP